MKDVPTKSAAAPLNCTVVTEPQLLLLVKSACKAGTSAAEVTILRLEQLMPREHDMLDAAGGAWIVLRVDGRSVLGKLLKRFDLSAKYRRGRGMFWTSSNHRGGIAVHIEFTFHRSGRVTGQELSIHEAANNAALPILLDGLGVQGHVHSYVD